MSLMRDVKRALTPPQYKCPCCIIKTASCIVCGEEDGFCIYCGSCAKTSTRDSYVGYLANQVSWGVGSFRPREEKSTTIAGG